MWLCVCLSQHFIIVDVICSWIYLDISNLVSLNQNLSLCFNTFYPKQATSNRKCIVEEHWWTDRCIRCQDTFEETDTPADAQTTDSASRLRWRSCSSAPKRGQSTTSMKPWSRDWTLGHSGACTDGHNCPQYVATRRIHWLGNRTMTFFLRRLTLTSISAIAERLEHTCWTLLQEI